MSKLISTIDQDLKQAMREKKEFERDVLRMLVSALRNKKIELYGNNNKDLNDEEALAVIKSEIKKRKDSIASYKQGERNRYWNQWENYKQKILAEQWEL